MRCIFSISFLSLLASCQTTPKIVDINLPSEFRSLFTSCGRKDGAVSLQVYNDPQKFIGSADLEWISTAANGWSADILNPIGQTVLKLNFDPAQGKISKSGDLEEKLPDMQVGKDGFLEIDGHQVMIRLREMPCYLGFRLPDSWLNDVIAFDRGKTSSSLEFEDDFRRIAVQLQHTESMTPLKVCSTVSWKRFLGIVRSEVSICYVYEQPTAAELTGSFAYLLRWIQLDEQE